VELLREKCGSQASPREFRRMLKEVIEADLLPDYTLDPDWEQSLIVIRSRKSLLSASG
jgi:hypothetical protein